MMKSNPIFNVTRTALITVSMGLCVAAVSAQPTMPMPAEIVKPLPKAGMDMKQGMEMKQGMDMKSMMTDMHNKMMGMKSTGNVDTDFAMMMRIHHQSAVAMGEAQLQNGKDPEMRSMAKNIIRDQKKEIAVFDKFLAKRGDAGMKMGEPGMQMKK